MLFSTKLFHKAVSPLWRTSVSRSLLLLKCGLFIRSFMVMDTDANIGSINVPKYGALIC